MSRATRKFASLAEFYPYYLGEHQNPRCRDAHFVGTTFGLACCGIAVRMAAIA